MEAASSREPIRVAELMAALSLATDLAVGQPLEHELGVCLSALELARRLGCDEAERREVYYVALLAHVGCTASARDAAALLDGDDIAFQQAAVVLGPVSEPAEGLRFLAGRFASDRPLPARLRLVAGMLTTGHRLSQLMPEGVCESGRLLARRLRLGDEVATALGQITARWDGKGHPAVGGEQIRRATRIVRVAHDLVVTLAGARDHAAAIAALEARRGRGYDPQVVDAALTEPDTLLERAGAPGAWERVIDAEPSPVATISRAGLPAVARALGEFADVKLAFLHGHSTRVAELAATAAHVLGCPHDDIDRIRTAGYLHDLGRVSVPNGVWERSGALGAGDWERVRLHPYYTERVLERSGALAPLARLAGSHHERLDGSGYHRGATAAQLDVGVRLLAAADAYDAMTHDRPHRAALEPAEARGQLGDLVGAGRLDRRTVNAVLEAAGAAPLRLRQAHPAGLTDREVEVLRLLARGESNKAIARALVITQKTAGHHVEHIYAKTGVSTRAGAALFAMQHDLVE